MDQQPHTNSPQPAAAPQYSKGQLAVARANMPSDNTVLVATFIGFFFYNVGVFYYYGTSRSLPRRRNWCDGRANPALAETDHGFV